MSASLVGSEMCIRDRPASPPSASSGEKAQHEDLLIEPVDHTLVIGYSDDHRPNVRVRVQVLSFVPPCPVGPPRVLSPGTD
eukprot:6337618-Alexandrium_andersonii.AAC.1